MLTSFPRRLATIPFFAIAIIIYLFSITSQRQSTLKSTQDLSGWNKSPSPYNHATATAPVALGTPVPESAAPQVAYATTHVAVPTPVAESIAPEIAAASPDLASPIAVVASAIYNVEPKQNSTLIAPCWSRQPYRTLEISENPSSDDDLR